MNEWMNEKKKNLKKRKEMEEGSSIVRNIQFIVSFL